MNRVKLQFLASRITSLANTIPKDENRIIFYSTPDVSDNALTLFKYVHNLNKGHELVWLLNNPRKHVVTVLQEKYPEVKTVT
ncbi:CDP-glycerol glycerophosphotransferase family protein [Thermococcus gorgonarius]|uniref:Uncharacterized protein n=1 Tax=Thermococcus gorgonarius TaxID=71997 RepID=A0A2Z2MAW2_THEGO|nr:CDP-glycerol glycerophosphotransferase family protein [Thermococcus gorgonarius]ASJ01665.1 hypothetical protein A3K92_09325 [Thermococcus gorgonarius]